MFLGRIHFSNERSTVTCSILTTRKSSDSQMVKIGTVFEVKDWIKSVLKGPAHTE